MKIIVVGNMTWDRVEGGRIAGGSVLYSSRVYAELGHDVSVYGNVSDIESLDPRVEILDCAGEAPIFENLYDDRGSRRQRVWRVGGVIPPRSMEQFELVHVAPVLDEVDLEEWEDALRVAPTVVAGLQGWLRRVDGDGWVEARGWGDRPIPFDLVSLSQEDIVGLGPDFVDHLRRLVPRVALTYGARGATIYGPQNRVDAAGWTIEAMDPTGAGDVFAAALTHGLFGEGWSEARASEFACGAAAHVVSDLGQQALETLAIRLAEYLQ